MNEKNTASAREMAAFCQENVKESTTLGWSFMLATLVSAVLVVLTLDPEPLAIPWNNY